MAGPILIIPGLIWLGAKGIALATTAIVTVAAAAGVAAGKKSGKGKKN